MEQAKDAVDTVENATDEDLAYIVEKGLPLTLDSLREAAANRTSGTAASESQTVGTVASPEAQSEDAAQSIANESYTPKGQQLLTARRQLEEIRLAMTVEANYRLLKQGVSIDTEPLVKLVEQLKDQENAYFFRVSMSRPSSGYQATPPEMLMCSCLPLGRMDTLRCRAALSPEVKSSALSAMNTVVVFSILSSPHHVEFSPEHGVLPVCDN